MNANGFTPNSGFQSAVSNERFKPLFQSSSSATEINKGLLSYKGDLSLSLKSGESSGRQVFSKSIEFSLGVKFESSYEFKVPSPQDVAATVLGFVENRINSEKQSGASLEKLNNLMAQARSGIEKGYAQAEKDIKDLGLMTDELAEDISKGFNLITDGLGNISQSISGFLPDPIINSSSPSVDRDNPVGQSIVKEIESESLFSQSSVSALGDADKPSASKFISLDQFSENTADFVLNTREGDQILIRMADFQALNYANNGKAEALDVSQSSRFEFSVRGSLNESELQAINDVLEQVGNISSLFFNDQFEEAFNSALSLGFDPEQIASFSLDLSKIQVQEVRTYQESSSAALDSYKRNQPLVNVAQQFEKLNSLLEPLARFEEINSMIQELVNKAIEAYDVKKASVASSGLNEALSNYEIFSDKIMGSILFADQK